MSIITTTTDLADRDYFWLIAQIKSWMHRSDMSNDIPTFILLAEARIVTLLESRLNDTIGTITTVAGQATADLPSPLLRVRSMSIVNVDPVIDYLTPEQLAARQETAGAPRFYTTQGGSVRFSPTPDAVYQVTCAYQAEPLALNSEAPTNALLDKWPNVYLFGALIEAADWARDDAALSKWQGKFQAAIAAINLIDWHHAGPMRVRSDVRSN